jgi:hypothetical protein
MSPVILVVMPEGYKGRAFIAKNALTLTTSKVEKSIYRILEINPPGILTQVVGAAERFGFFYRVLDAGPPLPRWPLRIIFRRRAKNCRTAQGSQVRSDHLG